MNHQPLSKSPIGCLNNECVHLNNHYMYLYWKWGYQNMTAYKVWLSKYLDCMPLDHWFWDSFWDPLQQRKTHRNKYLLKLLGKWIQCPVFLMCYQLPRSKMGMYERAENNSVFPLYLSHLPEWFLVLRSLKCYCRYLFSCAVLSWMK